MSLQRRVILAGLIWALVTTFAGAFALTGLLDEIANRRFNALLKERHTQVISALGNAQSPESIEDFLTDPAYFRIYSGRYWQVTDAEGQRFTSRSLFDAQLHVDETTHPTFWEHQGPDGIVRGLSEQINMEEYETVWNVTVAESLSALTAERAEMRRNVTYAFGFIGALGIAAAALLTSMLLAPLRKLRQDVKRRWDAGNVLVPEQYPAEVAPLVVDINNLMGRNREIVDRGRRQAADLAHALKTPSAALRNELGALSDQIDHKQNAIEALDRIDAQIVRSLARMRAANTAETVNLQTDIAVSIARLERLFRSLPETSGKIFDINPKPGLVAIDQQDLEELLGNLLENAFKWCETKVRLNVEPAAEQVMITVEDDGPGIDPKRREAVLAEGARLDTSVPGTGLGLSIANDLVSAYGGSIALVASKLGGLSVQVMLPRTTRAFEKR